MLSLNVTSLSQSILLFCLLLGLSPGQQVVPEICDNGIDDDKDGLIDIQDDDCFCPDWKTESLIPNSSFELQDCCPESASMVSCATDWLQASLATPDYFHACDYSGEIIFDLPKPIPEGEGFVGFIDGVFTGDYNPNWKEYVGSCLTEPLLADSAYQLQFYVGFLDREVSPEINMAIFGSRDCKTLPFDTTDNSFGCPSRNPKWVRLGTIGAAGHNEWKQQQIIFTSSNDIEAIVIGPDCSPRSDNNNPYHFLDHVVLAKLNDFDVNIHAGKDLCAADFSLSIRKQENARYQWYKDGVAIANATQSNLTTLAGHGRYQVRIQTNSNCRLSKIYNYFPPYEFVKLDVTTCQGKAYALGDHQLTSEGTYQDTFKTINHCDSIVVVNLKLESPKEQFIEARIFPGEQFQIGSHSFDTAGEYSQTIPSLAGCDSTVHLQLTQYATYIPSAFSPNSDGTNDIFTLQSDAGLKSISSLTIFDRSGNLMYDEKDLALSDGWNGIVNGKRAQNGVYIYQAVVLMDDNKQRSLTGTFSLIQ